MSETMLLIDQGNTQVKWLPAIDGVLQTALHGRGDLAAMRAAVDAFPGAMKQARISGVAGQDRLQEVVTFCRDAWNIEAQVMKSRPEQGGVRNAYREPGRLGVDRWLALVGAVSEYGKPVVVWDMGTASTLDAVDARGRHLGGMIYPGPATMLRSLTADTRLPVPMDFDDAGIISWVGAGENTRECILKGVLAAQVGTLNQFLRHVSLQMREAPQLIATGGAAENILPLLDFEYINDPWLVFRGMLVDV